MQIFWFIMFTDSYLILQVPYRTQSGHSVLFLFLCDIDVSFKGAIVEYQLCATIHMLHYVFSHMESTSDPSNTTSTTNEYIVFSFLS